MVDEVKREAAKQIVQIYKSSQICRQAVDPPVMPVMTRLPADMGHPMMPIALARMPVSRVTSQPLGPPPHFHMGQFPFPPQQQFSYSQ